MDRRIGAQLFTVRDYTQTIEGFEESCKKVSEMGYQIVQVSGTPLPADEMRCVLDKYGLKAVTTHRHFYDFLEKTDEIIEYNKILGCDLCGLGMAPLKFTENNQVLTDFIKEINKICETLKKEGMYFGYHNHEYEFGKLDGKMVYERFIEETDPENFNFIVDTYWIQYGGKNPATLIEKLGKRAMAVHFKDYKVNTGVRGVPEMCEVGQGNLDWDGIIAACDCAGTRWALVEEDKNWVDNDPFKSLKMSYDYLKTKGFN